MLIAALFLFSSPLKAQELPQVKDIPTGNDVIISLRKGESAPYDGQLFDNPTSMRWANWLRQYKVFLPQQVELERSLGEAKAEVWKQKYNLLEKQYTFSQNEYGKRITNLELQVASPPWYQTVWFGMAVGATVTATASVIAVLATKLFVLKSS